MQPLTEAYLDIETTGLSPEFNEITVIGIYLCNDDKTRFIQLVGHDVTACYLQNLHLQRQPI